MSSPQKQIVALGLAILFFTSIIPHTMGGTPHAINGYVLDLDGNPAHGAIVYVNNTRSDESLSEITDSLGRYSVDIDAYESGYQIDDVLNVTAVYPPFKGTDNITVNPEPAQRKDIILDMHIHLIEGNVTLPDGKSASYYSVFVMNQDKDESEFVVTDLSGHYWTDLATYDSGYDLNDDITVYVDFNGFSGTNSTTVSSNSSDRVDILLSDVQPPVITVYQAPSNVSLEQDFQIVAHVMDNTFVDNAWLYHKGPGETVFNELEMIQDDGDNNDWDGDGMPDLRLFGQSTWEGLPPQTDLGVMEFYLKTSDGYSTVTDPVSGPESNPHTIDILDTTPPDISHDHVWEMEAGVPLDILAKATDNVAIGKVWLHTKVTGEPDFTETEMEFNGNPDEYNATIPGLNYTGSLGYYITCNDTSNNTARLPGNGSLTINVVDTTPPDITHHPINSIPVNTAINITCTIEDMVGLDSVRLNYTDVHGSGFNVSMSGSGNDGYYYLIPSGQDQPGIFYYTIWAQDGSDNLASFSHAIQVNDADTPVITHVPPGHLDYDSETIINAYVQDNVNISEVTLCYEPVGGSGFISVGMNSTDASSTHGNFSANIPAQPLGKISYYINASDDAYPLGNNISWPALSPYHEVEVQDNTKPWISLADFDTPRPTGTPANISVNVTDNHQVGSVFLYYLNQTADAWSRKQMAHESGTMYSVNLTAAMPGDVKFYIWANDSSGNNLTRPAQKPKLNSFVLEFIDTISPEIILFGPEESGINRTINIFASVSDDQDITYLGFHYKGTEDQSFINAPINMLPNGTYRAEVPPQNLSGQVSAYVMASDGTNLNQSQTLTIPVINGLPEVIHNPVDSAPVMEDVAFVCQVFDDLGVEQVVFSWKAIGTDTYTDHIMNLTSKNTYRTVMCFSSDVIIQYHITAHDLENHTVWPRENDQEIIIMDLDAPVISHRPLEQLNISSRPIISAEINDNIQVTSATVWFRNSTSETFFSRQMSSVSGTPGMYSAVLGTQPAGNFTYYIEAGDGVNTAETGEYTVEVIDDSGTDWWSPVLFIILVVLLLVAVFILYLYHRR